jgi:hypothetical protein
LPGGWECPFGGFTGALVHVPLLRETDDGLISHKHCDQSGANDQGNVIEEPTALENVGASTVSFFLVEAGAMVAERAYVSSSFQVIQLNRVSVSAEGVIVMYRFSYAC